MSPPADMLMTQTGAQIYALIADLSKIGHHVKAIQP